MCTSALITELVKIIPYGKKARERTRNKKCIIVNDCGFQMSISPLRIKQGFLNEELNEFDIERVQRSETHCKHFA